MSAGFLYNPSKQYLNNFKIFTLLYFHLILIFFSVGPKSGGSSDTSPPTMQSFAEESSPENLNPNNRLVNGQSTESLDSLSDESGGAHPQNNQKASRNPVPHPRKVCKQTADFTQFY